MSFPSKYGVTASCQEWIVSSKYSSDGAQLHRSTYMKRMRQSVKVGDLVRYNPLVSYLVNNHELLNELGVVVELKPSDLTVVVLIGETRFRCSIEDVETIEASRD